MAIWTTAIPVIVILIVAVAAWMTWTMSQAKKSGYPLEDERTRRIHGKAGLATMMLTFYYLIALNLYNIINIEWLGGVERESMLVINSALIMGGCTFLDLVT